MILIIVVTALIGLWFCRTRSWFKWVAILFAWFLAANFLFSAYGTLDDPSGDGLVTRQIRRAAGDGPLVGFYALGFIVFHVGFTLYGLFRLWDAWRDHRAAPPEAEEGSDLLPDLTGRKQLETVGVLALAGLWAAATWPSGGVAPSELAGAGGEIEAIALAGEAGAGATGKLVAEPSVESDLRAAAAEINARAPQPIDEITTLVGASAAGRELTHHYEFAASDVSSVALRKLIRDEVLPKICIGAARARMRDDGVTYTYSYVGPDRKAPVAVSVNEKICAQRER